MASPLPIDRLDRLEARVDTLGAELGNLRAEMRTGFQAVEYQVGATEDRLVAAMHAAIGTAVVASEHETRRYMRVLHEEVLERIRTIGEGRAP